VLLFHNTVTTLHGHRKYHKEAFDKLIRITYRKENTAHLAVKDAAPSLLLERGKAARVAKLNPLLHSMVQGYKRVVSLPQMREPNVQRKTSRSLSGLTSKHKNSKPGEIERETMPPNSLLHLFLPELDSAAGTLSVFYKNNSMARSAVQLEKTISNFLRIAIVHKAGILMSLDVTGGALRQSEIFSETSSS
jgi:hypothetical protein